MVERNTAQTDPADEDEPSQDKPPAKVGNTIILPYNEANITQAAERLREGGLVSFPTETVYGLGANALDPDACTKIFTTKERPLTDPLIVHVQSMEHGLELIDQSSPEIVELFKKVGAKYWPGPLTMVVKANLDKIPLLITAQTGYVGIRLPNHPIALDLITKAGVPVAAPSANKFGHVSPTKAEHVYNDFHKDSDVVIIDGGCCDFGIESTVLKLQQTQVVDAATEFELEIIRKGGVSIDSLQKVIAEIGLGDSVAVTQLGKKHAKKETERIEAPGQFLRHYSPNISSFLYQGELTREELVLENAIILDFGKMFADKRNQVKHYMDLSPDGDLFEAINKVYDALRWAETNEDAEFVLMTDILHMKDQGLLDSNCKGMEHIDALYDRLFRAASGKNA